VTQSTTPRATTAWPFRAARARGPAVLALVYAVPIVLWAQALPLQARFGDPATSLVSVAVMLALAGVCAFSANLILGGRLGPVASFFGGVDRMYAIHQINGRVAFLLLLSHGVLIFASRAVDSFTAALQLAVPSVSGWTVFFGVLALAAMTVTIALTLYARLNHEVFVYVQRSFGFVFLIAMLHVFRTPGTKAASPLLTFYLAALALVAVGAWAYRSLFNDVLVRRHDYAVVGLNPLDESVLEVAMRARGEPMRYRPGQFAYVTFRSESMRREFHAVTTLSKGQTKIVTLTTGAVSHQFHPFSITSAPEQPELRVTVKAVGDYTSAMRALELGAAARVEGPYGSFSYLSARARRQVWIAGGIGITPFLSMARSLPPTGYDIVLFFAVRYEHQAYFLEELADISARVRTLRIERVVEEREGFLTAERVAATSGELRGVDILICGPPAMIHNLRAQLEGLGVPGHRIHYELFGFVNR
jgi:predicted ferric reductase